MISYPHYLNYSFLSFLELKKYHLSYQITQITKIVNLFQEQNDKIVTIVTNIIHGFFSVWKKLAHIEPCLKFDYSPVAYTGQFCIQGNRSQPCTHCALERTLTFQLLLRPQLVGSCIMWWSTRTRQALSSWTRETFSSGRPSSLLTRYQIGDEIG